jgi:hypothetical protein
VVPLLGTKIRRSSRWRRSVRRDYAYRWMPLRRRYTLSLLALVMAGAVTQERGERRPDALVLRCARVVDQHDRRAAPLARHDAHGRSAAARDRREPQAYYHGEGPLG